MKLDLTDRVALVTGAARGIGRTTARFLAAHGARVGLLDLDETAGEATAQALAAEGARCFFQRCDVGDAASVREAVGAVAREFGGLDILVNNAGITRDGLLLRLKEEDWDAVLRVNLRGPYLCTQAALRWLLKSRAGRIINIASVVGLVGNPGQANYAASKGGLVAFTKAVARELAPKRVTVNAVAPGYIETEMTAKLAPETQERLKAAIPMMAYGTPEDVAGAVLFLASDLARYITGHVLLVSGGMAM